MSEPYNYIAGDRVRLVVDPPFVRWHQGWRGWSAVELKKGDIVRIRRFVHDRVVYKNGLGIDEFLDEAWIEPVLNEPRVDCQPETLQVGDFVRINHEYTHTGERSPHFLAFLLGRHLRPGDLIRISKVDDTRMYYKDGRGSEITLLLREGYAIHRPPPRSHAHVSFYLRGVAALVALFLAPLIPWEIPTVNSQYLNEILTTPLVQEAVAKLVATLSYSAATLACSGTALLLIRRIVNGFAAWGDHNRRIEMETLDYNDRRNKVNNTNRIASMNLRKEEMLAEEAQKTRKKERKIKMIQDVIRQQNQDTKEVLRTEAGGFRKGHLAEGFRGWARFIRTPESPVTIDVAGSSRPAAIGDCVWVHSTDSTGNIKLLNRFESAVAIAADLESIG